jgi:uncharacterized protein YdhG (YjbR/CyaY superfamily)
MADKIKFNTVDDYMTTLPEKSRAILEEVRQVILETAKDAEEVISYQLPALKFHGMLIYHTKSIFPCHFQAHPYSKIWLRNWKVMR